MKNIKCDSYINYITLTRIRNIAYEKRIWLMDNHCTEIDNINKNDQVHKSRTPASAVLFWAIHLRDPCYVILRKDISLKNSRWTRFAKLVLVTGISCTVTRKLTPPKWGQRSELWLGSIRVSTTALFYNESVYNDAANVMYTWT